MGSSDRRQQFKQLMERLIEDSGKLLKEENSPKPMELFLGTYLGLCFIEGYRIQQNIGKGMMLLSQFNMQNAFDYSMLGVKKLHSSYRIVYPQFREDINENKQRRLQIFQQVIDLINYLKEGQGSFNCLEVHFIFVSNSKFAIADKETLEKGAALDVSNFYERDYPFNYNRGFKVPIEKIEGVKLHLFTQLFLKGSGIIRNYKFLQEEVFYQLKFNYNLKKIINTICFIIGKEIIEGKYVTMSSEKWMRKSTKKKFKRFDLLMRNDDKVCIIDWKFSRFDANYKISQKIIQKRNKTYFQLAMKEFNSAVELKFYCFHQKSEGKYHHRYTVAQYQYNVESVSISDEELDEEASNQQKEKKEEVEKEVIQIDSS